jgi:hypothetical protein
MDPFIISYSDSVCGAGKTEEAIKEILESRTDTIYAVPTTELGGAVEERMNEAGYKGLGFEVVRIDKETYGGSVVKILHAELTKNIGIGKVVVICTHSSLKEILASYSIPMGSWSLYVDEPLNTVEIETVESESYLSIYSNLFQPINKLKEIEPRIGGKLKVKGIGAGANSDEVYKAGKIKELCGFVSSKNYSVSALKSTEEASAIQYIAYLDPKSMQVFKSVTMLAAKFTDTLIYQLWSKEPDLAFTPCDWNLRFTKHKNGQNVSLYYLLKHENKPWTYSTLKKGNNPHEIHRKAIAGVSSDIIIKKHNIRGVEVCLLRANSDLYKDSKSPSRTFKFVSGMPFGLNSYDNMNAAVYLQTQMPYSAPDVAPWFGQKKISLKNKRAIYHSEAYQMVLRCSLRNPCSNSDVVIVVGDKGTADYIADQFEDRPEPKYYQLKALEQVDTKRGVVGQPKSEELDVGEKTKRWMSRKLKKANKSMPIGTTSVGLMRRCISDYACSEDSCKDVIPDKNCSCYKGVRDLWEEQIRLY